MPAGSDVTAEEFSRASRNVLSATGSETLHFRQPIVVERAQGSKIIDIEGREFIDLVGGLGPMVLGHAHSGVVESVQKAAERGMHHAFAHPAQQRLATLMVEAIPCAERVLFCNSGTEATLLAMRLLRAYTGKETIAIFEGSYHGMHDSVLTSVIQDSPVDEPEFGPRKGGIPPAAQSTVTMLPYWNDAAFGMIESMKDSLAAVFVEPVQGGNPQSGQGEWLRQLAATCTRVGVPLLFDEVITGFRLGLGGGQEWFGVTPDLATYGKVLGGGMPMGAIAGRADIMETFVAHHSPDFPEEREAFNTGTFHGNPMSTAAGYATIHHLATHPELYEELNRRSDRFAATFNEFARTHDIPAQMNSCGSFFLIYFGPEQDRPTSRGLTASGAHLGPSGIPYVDVAREFFARVLARGVIIPPAPHHIHISMAHTDEDVDAVLAAMRESLLELRESGLV